jgi:hypothetical protein
MTNLTGGSPDDVAMGNLNFEAAALIARTLGKPELPRAARNRLDNFVNEPQLTLKLNRHIYSTKVQLATS